jgi:beta-phosphoglucomutase-like phosphatase (HAD superfamily)
MMNLTHKPSPKPYLETAKRLGINLKECLVFEDSENGVKSAKSADMFCIGVNIGNYNTQNLKDADKVIFSFKELFIIRV